MKIVVIAQSKGGVGKTACAAHLSWYGQEAQERVLAVDLDRGNLSKSLSGQAMGVSASALFSGKPEAWLAVKPSAERCEGKAGRLDLIAADNLMANLIYMPLEQARSRFRESMLRLVPQYDLGVIDTAPGLSIALAAALNVADAVLAPVEMETYSIEGIKELMKIILHARAGNPKLQFLGILPSRVDLRNPRQVANLEQVRHAYGGLLTPFNVGLRSSVAQALAVGEPVWKSNKTAARAAGAEMRALGQYVLDKLGRVEKSPSQPDADQQGKAA